MNKCKFPKTICLVGGDGTGKTTHARRIITDLEKQGKKCNYVWFGQPYILSYPFMFLCNLLGYTKNHHLPSNVVSQEHQYYRNKAIAFLWPWIQFFDLALLMLIRVYLPIRRGKIVVCDRFIYDTLVELMADTNDRRLYGKTVGKLMNSLKPIHAIVLRLDIDPKIAFGRRNDVPDLRFLTIRRACYEVISQQLDIITIDADRPFENVSSLITSYSKM